MMGEKELREWMARLDERLNALKESFDRHCEKQFSLHHAVLVLFTQAIIFFCIGKFV